PKAGTSAAAPDSGKIDSPAIAPDHEAPKADAPRMDAPKVEATRSEIPKVESIKTSAPGTAGKMLILAHGDRSWRGETDATAESDHGPGKGPGKRRRRAVAPVVALPTIAGAPGGAFAPRGIIHPPHRTATAPPSGTLDAAIARIDADVLALKAGLEHT